MSYELWTCVILQVGGGIGAFIERMFLWACQRLLYAVYKSENRTEDMNDGLNGVNTEKILFHAESN